jgi:hypothetical protein
MVGAGASVASGRYAEGDRPPLTRELFDAKRGGDLLRIYTLAQAAESAMRSEMEIDTAIQLEEALRRLQNDGYAHHRQMALGVPPYLQALMLGYSRRLSAFSLRYGRLVDQLLRIGTEVHFVSLNYDTLLDHHLAAFTPLNTLDAYVNTGLDWTLIKPHGSVAWYVPQPETLDPASPPLDREIAVGPIECVPVNNLDLHVVRGTTAADTHGLTNRYPAIALPDGPKDRLVLPDSHRQRIEDVLQSREIQLLVLGYSGLDSEILTLIGAGGCTIRRLTVVNRGAKAALEVLHRIKVALPEGAIFEDVVDGSFESWTDGDGLRKWVEEYRGPFDSVTTPEKIEALLERRKADAEMQKFRKTGIHPTR